MLYEALNLAVLKCVPPSAVRILDIGCGTGNLGAALKERHGNAIVVGITFSTEEAAKAEDKLDNILVADLDFFVPPADLGHFDVVICSHVLEHLQGAARLLKLLHSHFTASGLLVVALPNVLYWKQRLKFLHGSFAYTSGGLMDSTHVRFFDWNTARNLVTSCGYKIETATAHGVFPLPIIRRFLPDGIAGRIDLTATRCFPGLFGAQFVITAHSAHGIDGA